MRIEIKGPIIADSDQWIYDIFGIPATSPSKVNKVIQNAIRNNVKELTVVINSGGGSVFYASEIYTELKKFAGNVKGEIVGIAASAASVIASACKFLSMTPTGMVMFHNASNSAYGDYRAMDHNSEFLQKVNKTIINAYMAKTGKTEDELKVMMDKETWMTAQEAKELGYIDEIMFENEVDAVANMDSPELGSGLIPKEVINKMRELLANQKVEVSAFNSIDTVKNEKGVEKSMDLQTLKNEHPELVKAIQDEAINAERERIKEIENIATPGMEEIVNKAKFETGASAAETAMEILKAQKAQNQETLKNIIEDAQPLNDIVPEEAPTANKDAELDNVLNEIF